jgi:hypothetical protein
MQSVRFLTEIFWDLILICNMCVAKCLTFVKTSLAFAISPFSKGIARLVSREQGKSKVFHEMAFIALSKTLALTTLPLHIKMGHPVLQTQLKRYEPPSPLIHSSLLSRPQWE